MITKRRQTYANHIDFDSFTVFTVRCYASAVCAVMRCLSIRLSVTFVDHVKTNKRIFEFFSPSGSHAILVVLYQRGCRYSDGNPPNVAVECKGGMKKSRFSIIIFTNISLYLRNGYS